jgi:hypothetical protein
VPTTLRWGLLQPHLHTHQGLLRTGCGSTAGGCEWRREGAACDLRRTEYLGMREAPPPALTRTSFFEAFHWRDAIVSVSGWEHRRASLAPSSTYPSCYRQPLGFDEEYQMSTPAPLNEQEASE